MIRLFCRGNVIEYTGNGWLQCSRSVTCPKKKNPKILGFDCFLYVDNLPENVTLSSPDIDISKEDVIESTFPIEDITKHEDLTAITIIPVKEFARESIKDKGNGKEYRKDNQTKDNQTQKENKENINEKDKEDELSSIIISDVSDKSNGYNILDKPGDDRNMKTALDVKALIQKIKDAGEV